MPSPNSKEIVSNAVKRRAANIHPHFPQKNSPVSLSLYLRGCSAGADREFIVSSNAPATATFFSLGLYSTGYGSQFSLLYGGMYQAQMGTEMGQPLVTGTVVPTRLPTLFGLGVILFLGGQYKTNIWLASGEGGWKCVCLMRSSGLYSQYCLQGKEAPCWLQYAGSVVEGKGLACGRAVVGYANCMQGQLRY